MSPAFCIISNDLQGLSILGAIRRKRSRKICPSLFFFTIHLFLPVCKQNCNRQEVLDERVYAGTKTRIVRQGRQSHELLCRPVPRIRSVERSARNGFTCDLHHGGGSAPANFSISLLFRARPAVKTVRWCNGYCTLYLTAPLMAANNLLNGYADTPGDVSC